MANKYLENFQLKKAVMQTLRFDKHKMTPQAHLSLFFLPLQFPLLQKLWRVVTVQH